MHGGPPPLAHHRAHLHAAVQPVADLDRAHRRHERVGESGQDPPVDQEAAGRGAHLPGVHHLGRTRTGGGHRVGVGADDHRRVPAQLHDGRLHARRGQAGDVLADRYRAGEGDEPDRRRGDDAAGDLVGHPEHQVEHAGGRPASANARASRQTVPGTSSDGLITIEQPADSAAAILRIGPPAGKFHGTNAPTGPTGTCRTDRIWLGSGDDPPVGPAALLAVPFQQGGRPVHFAGRLRQRLALLQRHHPADVRGPLVDEAGGAVQDRRGRPGPRRASRKAARAAAMARSTSSGSANGTRPSACPVAGLTTSSPRPAAPWPTRRRCTSRRRGNRPAGPPR